MTEGKDSMKTDHNTNTVSDQKSLMEWWPNQLKLNVLSLNSSLTNPMSKGYDYKTAFCELDYDCLVQDLYDLMTNSKRWWPADFGNYGPLFIRMAWHSAGTYRVGDGRGGASRGTQRFAPENSWPDNANLDKARRLLWPIKQKYGDHISWADLMILAGTCALEYMGVKTIGFAGGREDVWEPQTDVYWGREMEWLANNRRDSQGQLENPLAAVQMGLIYVNPEGPDGNPDPAASAKDVRVTFSRMAMNDEETVALVAGGHTFGKCHGAASPSYVGPAPEAAPIQEQGLGWKNRFGTGNASDTITSGIEGAWKAYPTTWNMGYLTTLFKYEWELVKSPAGAYQWLAKDVEPEDMVEDAFHPCVKHRPMMTTADLSLRYDPQYCAIARDFMNHPDKFEQAFARAWFKLTHRDLGPVTRYLGPDIPKETFIWQDPIPPTKYPVINCDDVKQLKRLLLDCGLTISEMVKTAWAAASSYRGSDRRGGANGGRIRLRPQNGWQVNEPIRLGKVINIYKSIQYRFHAYNNEKYVSIADLIVLGGCVGIECAIKNAGYQMDVPFTPGRMDASQEQTDIQSFNYLEPKADGFRNYVKYGVTDKPEDLLVDKAQLLNLTAPEMTVLLGGLRVLQVNYNGSSEGVFTNRRNCLTNDFFTNLLDQDIVWRPTSRQEMSFQGINRKTGRVQWTASRVDLVFGYNAQLRAVSEVYASCGNEEKFMKDFVAAWTKVMNADRFDLR